MRKYSSLLAAVVIFRLLTFDASAQEAAKPAQSAGGSTEQPIVLLNVRVTDERGRAVLDARQEDFQIVEDGVPQTISFFSKEEVPLSYGLVIDNSGSLRTQLDRVIEAGKFVVNNNRPGDETFLVRFVSSESIQQVSGFTSSKAALFSGLDSLFIEGGQTAIIDAVYLSADYAAKNSGRTDGNIRRALVLVTDGEDRGSQFNRAKLTELLHREDIQIFVIGLTKQLEDKRARERATELLNFLARETGGRAFFPASVSELPKIAEEITRDMRTQYLIGYVPASAKQDGGAFHKVQVTVAATAGGEKRAAVTRVGYMSAPKSK